MPYEQHVCSKCLRGTWTLHQPLGEIIIVYPAINDRPSITKKFKVCIPHIDKTIQYLNGSIIKYPKGIEPPQTPLANYGLDIGKTKSAFEDIRREVRKHTFNGEYTNY